MELAAGQRLNATGRSVYQIDRCCAESPCFRLYAARKVFLNYRYEQREYYEAAEEEWVEVRIRTAAAPPSSPELASLAQQQLRYEITEVLARAPQWFAEPLDVISLPAAASTGAGSEIAIVLSRLGGENLREWRLQRPQAAIWGLELALETLSLLETLHGNGQILGGFGPDDFVIDECGRLFCTASDRVHAAARSASLRPLLTPESFPAEFSSPETLDPRVPLSVQSDLYSWAALCEFLLTGGEREAARTALAAVASEAPELLRTLSPRLEKADAVALVSVWQECLHRCLAPLAADRPASIDDLRKSAVKQKIASSGGLWRRLVVDRLGPPGA